MRGVDGVLMVRGGTLCVGPSGPLSGASTAGWFPRIRRVLVALGLAPARVVDDVEDASSTTSVAPAGAGAGAIDGRRSARFEISRKRSLSSIRSGCTGPVRNSGEVGPGQVSFERSRARESPSPRSAVRGSRGLRFCDDLVSGSASHTRSSSRAPDGAPAVHAAKRSSPPGEGAGPKAPQMELIRISAGEGVAVGICSRWSGRRSFAGGVDEHQTRGLERVAVCVRSQRCAAVPWPTSTTGTPGATRARIDEYRARRPRRAWEWSGFAPAEPSTVRR